MDLSNNSDCFAPVNNATTHIDNVATFNCLPVLFSELVTAALFFAGFVAVMFIIWAGIKYIMSGGEADKVKGAKKTLTFAIIGLLLIFFSFAIINIIALITGTHCLNQFNQWSFEVCSK